MKTITREYSVVKESENMKKEKKNYCLYIHIFPNNKVYIGITSNKPEYRWNNGRGYSSQKLIYRAIKKYNWDNIQHIILFENLTEKEAKQKEIELIAQYKSNNKKFGYNSSIGGEGSSGFVMSEKQKREISERKKGKPRDEETKQKISNKLKGRIFTKTQRKRMSEAHKGKKLSVGAIEKLSERMKGNQYNCGKQRNKKYADKISKKIMCVETNEIFNSQTQASKIKNINLSNLIYAVKGKRKTAGGFHWKEVVAYQDHN